MMSSTSFSRLFAINLRASSFLLKFYFVIKFRKYAHLFLFAKGQLSVIPLKYLDVIAKIFRKVLEEFGIKYLLDLI